MLVILSVALLLCPLSLQTDKFLDLNTLESIGNHHDLGIFELDLQGGELLLDTNYLFSALEALGIHRFYICDDEWVLYDTGYCTTTC